MNRSWYFTRPSWNVRRSPLRIPSTNGLNSSNLYLSSTFFFREKFFFWWWKSWRPREQSLYQSACEKGNEREKIKKHEEHFSFMIIFPHMGCSIMTTTNIHSLAIVLDTTWRGPNTVKYSVCYESHFDDNVERHSLNFVLLPDVDLQTYSIDQYNTYRWPFVPSSQSHSTCPFLPAGLNFYTIVKCSIESKPETIHWQWVILLPFLNLAYQREHPAIILGGGGDHDPNLNHDKSTCCCESHGYPT